MAIAASCTLLFLLGGISLTQAVLNQTLPEPLITLGSLPPEEADGPYQNWAARGKYFLVVAVNETGLPNTDLPFTQTDTTQIAGALTEAGYQPLIENQPVLTGKEATRSAIIKAITTSHQAKSDQDIIALYVTGHASAGTKDLWVQTYGQDELGEGQGISLSELVTRTRSKESEAAFEGELAIIMDTCFSGQGALSKSLTLGELGRNTTIFSGSSSTQESCPLNAPDLPEISAFTYSLLQAMGPQWGQADGDGDGILRFAEVQIFSKNLLKKLWKAHKVDGLMQPKLFNANQEHLLAYRRDQVRVLNTPYRIALQTEEVSKALAAHLQTLGANPGAIPDVPQDAQALARGFNPDPQDFYAQAIQATAEARLTDARELFVKADQQSRTPEQAGQSKRYDHYLARARMESYDGKFTEAFSWYLHATKFNPPKDLQLINEIGMAGVRAGNYPAAEPYLMQAVVQQEQRLHPDDPILALSLNNLAALYQVQGKYAAAEPLYLRALQIHEVALGSEHLQVATSLSNLAELFRAQGKYADAKPLSLRALKITETALGPDHPSVAIRLDNLALLYRTQGKYTEAEPLLHRALSIDEAALGADHPDVAMRLNNLAALYQAQGKYADAEPLYHHALTISEQALGTQHPQVALSLNNLAALYKAQGKYAAAEPLYRRSYWIFYDRLGPEHPYVQRSYNNYQGFLKTSGQASDDDTVVRKLQQGITSIDAQSKTDPASSTDDSRGN